MNESLSDKKRLISLAVLAFTVILIAGGVLLAKQAGSTGEGFTF